MLLEHRFQRPSQVVQMKMHDEGQDELAGFLGHRLAGVVF